MSKHDAAWGNTARAVDAERQPTHRGSVPPPEDSNDAFDSFEVPAAVLCAVCGHADCEGCISEDTGESGVIAIVPWERPGPVWQRLWTTAVSTTEGAEAFFGALPRGAVEPALTFALVAEGLAVSSLVAVLLTIALVIFPDLALQLILDTELASTIGHWLAVGIPAVTLWMVAVHAVHGAAADRAARRFGAAHLPRRALRFGLYACGWDLMTSPLGIAATLLTRGFAAAGRLFGAALSVPARATVALVKGAYRLDDERARRVHRRAVAVAMAVTVASVLVLVLAALLI